MLIDLLPPFLFFPCDIENSLLRNVNLEINSVFGKVSKDQGSRPHVIIPLAIREDYKLLDLSHGGRRDRPGEQSS